MKKKMKKFIRFLISKNAILLIALFLQIVFLVSLLFFANKFSTKVIGGTITIIAFFVALLINNSNKHWDIKLAYIMMLVLFPFYTTLSLCLEYIGMGHKKFKKHLKKLYLNVAPLKQDENAMKALENDQHLGIVSYLKNTCGFPVYQNTQTHYFSTGVDQFEDMVKEIQNAKKFIFLEYYIISHGIFLDTIVEELKKKVKEGVEVRFMYDGTSSISKIPHGFAKQMQKAGLKCKMFMPVRAIISTEQNNRDHRKLLIIDNKFCFTGGINLADEYINYVQPYGYWKDAGIKLEGEAVTSLTQMFLKMWNFKQKQIENFEYYLNPHKVESDGFVLPFGDHPHDNEHVSKSVLLYHIINAKKYIHIATPYLILDDEIISAITNSAKRGVEVSILTPNIPDKRIVFWITQTNYRLLIKAGVNIYQYTPGFVHAKLFVCDDNIATIGSVNIDYRSMLLNFENQIWLHNNSSVEEIEEDFQYLFKQSVKIDTEKYKKINIFKRFIGRLFKIFTPLI